MICFFSSGNHRPIWHWLAMLRSWGLCPQAPGVYRFGLMGRDMTCGMPRPGYWPFGIVRRSGCPPAEPYPAYDALSSPVKRWVPVTFRNRNQKSGFAPIQCPVLLRCCPVLLRCCPVLLRPRQLDFDKRSGPRCLHCENKLPRNKIGRRVVMDCPMSHGSIVSWISLPRRGFAGPVTVT
jgi:hypothetical protein